MLDGFGVLFVDSCLDVACLCICCFSLFLVVSCCLISVPSALCLVFCEGLSLGADFWRLGVSVSVTLLIKNIKAVPFEAYFIDGGDIM